MVLGIRLSLRLRESGIGVINRIVPKTETPLCPKCGHPESMHKSGGLGCHAAYTEIAGKNLRRVVVCGCKHSARARKQAA